MAKIKRVLSELSSQGVVACSLAVLILVSLIAIFSTAGGPGEEIKWAGMTVKRLEPEVAAALGIPTDAGGVMVGEVAGIAGRSGVCHGDVLLSINGERVQDMVDFSKVAGDTDISKGGARLDIIRRGSRMAVLVLPSARALGAGRAQGQVAPGEAAPFTIDRRFLGIEAETFTAGEGRALGIPAGVRGVLIDGVARGSRAERAGLAANDVIVSVNGQRTDQTADLWNALAALDGRGDRVEFGVYRRGRLTFFTLVPEFGTLAGGFPGRMGGWGLGPGGLLVCPSCGTRVAHQRGVPCYSMACPSCGSAMIRAQ